MNDNVKYTIDQVSELVGVTKGALRYWEGVYGIEPSRNEGNHRRYTQAQVDTLIRIKDLYAEGFAAKGVKARLEEACGAA